ncbi:hypothetical protein DCAR_0521899 [Daucus carota subsp. sativus]|uniref:Aminotransferase class IV n=1 Tax=Daucus carota subsp. sativus TaxID=79200 RepID=A0AAF1B1F7_DAUCS|nr:hypothetical protein DCAR_0521899 [Daucus carota subsp. sativus]
MSNLDFLFVNGVVSPPSLTPSVATLLETHPGAYTTSRTHNNGSVLLFWERHLNRLANSARILLNSKPELLFEIGESRASFSGKFSNWDSAMKSLVNDLMRTALPVAVEDMKVGEELAVTTLVSGNMENWRRNEGLDGEEMFREVFDVYIRVGLYVPLEFGLRENGAHLAAVGPGRAVANAKYSEWVRVRKHLEKLRPPSATELILSNDGDHMLEGCLTNFFVVCLRDLTVYEVQTAPISDGVLPGVIRQIIIEACLKHGIPFREVAPSWSRHEQWEEAFITNSLRLLQHVETIRVPCSWSSLESKSWKDVNWEEKQFKEGPGTITSVLQEEIMAKAALEGYPVTSLPK